MMHNIAPPNQRIHPYDLFGKRMKKVIELFKQKKLDYTTYTQAMQGIYWEILVTQSLVKIPKEDFEYFSAFMKDIGLVRFGEQPTTPLTNERLNEAMERAEKLVKFYVDYGIKY